MKNFLARFLVLLLIAGFPAIMCAGPISMLFSAINPNFLRLTEKVVCRETGQAVVQTYHTRPGSTSFEMYCIDVEGQRSKDDVILLAVGVLFLAYFVIFSVGIGAYNFWQGLKGKRAAPDDASPSPRRRTAGALVDSQARDLLARGNKIEAIKIVRQATGSGLKEAKEYVEAIESRSVVTVGESPPPSFDEGISGDRVAKMRELKQMLDENLITEQEYEAKKKEILSQF